MSDSNDPQLDHPYLNISMSGNVRFVTAGAARSNGSIGAARSNGSDVAGEVPGVAETDVAEVQNAPYVLNVRIERILEILGESVK